MPTRLASLLIALLACALLPGAGQDADPPERTRALALVFDGLEGSIVYGMGGQAGAPGLEVVGKTGTASSAAGWTHAWFAGFAPDAAPEIVLVVFLEKGRGGVDAAPVAEQIFAAYAAAREKR